MVDDRPGTYNKDLVWDEDAGTWIANDGRGGAIYQQNLIAIGLDDDENGVIYFGGI